MELLKKKLQGPARDRRLDEESAALLAARTISNASRLPKTLPMLLRNHIFHVIHNALATGARQGWIQGASRHCQLCGAALENLAHLHVHCPVTRAAKSMILNSVPDRQLFLPLLEAKPAEFLLQEADPDPKLMAMKAAFSLWQFGRAASKSAGIMRTGRIRLQKLLKPSSSHTTASIDPAKRETGTRNGQSS